MTPTVEEMWKWLRDAWKLATGSPDGKGTSEGFAELSRRRLLVEMAARRLEVRFEAAALAMRR